MDNNFNRRDALRAGAALAAAALPGAQAATSGEPLRVGFVGTGGRGTGLIRNLLRTDAVEIPALCDIDEENLARAQSVVEDSGKPRPEGYSRGERDFVRLCDRDDLDVVINATPWQWHTPVAVAAMKAGKHTATEVPAAQTVEECWELVETSEKTGKHCAMLENDCYYRYVLLILNLVRAGLLGEVLYAEGGYMHDIRAVKFDTVPNGEPWRLQPSIDRDGNLYPTHPLGPIAWWMDINRGDQFSHLVSMSSRGLSLQQFAQREFGPSDPRSRQNYALGDVNTTMIRTHKERTILLYHDTNTPRVKEHIIRVQGSKGVYNQMLDKIYIDGQTEDRHNPDWMSTEPYKEKYDHQLWRNLEEQARGSGHGGIDYLMVYRLVKNLREGRAPDVDVYDAAAWSAIVPLTEESVAGRSKSVDIPDFTRGKWKLRAPVDPDKLV